jgi:hypothetical protein
MAYDILLERHGRILRINYSGRVDLAERREAATKALDRAAHDSIDRFLLDYRQASCLVGDDPAIRALAQYLADKLGHRNARVAWLVTHDHQLSHGVEDLARGFGVANQRFCDLDAAFAWLQQPDAPKPAAQPQASKKMGRSSALVFPPRRALALAMKASDPQVPMPPVQFAAIAQLTQELLDAGLEDATVLDLAKRMFEVVRSVPPLP